MRTATQYRLEASARTETSPFSSGRLISSDLGDGQVIATDTKILFGIRHSRFHQLEYWQSGALVNEAQHLQRFVRALAAYHVDHGADLLRRLGKITDFCLNIMHLSHSLSRGDDSLCSLGTTECTRR